MVSSVMWQLPIIFPASDGVGTWSTDNKIHSVTLWGLSPAINSKYRPGPILGTGTVECFFLATKSAIFCNNMAVWFQYELWNRKSELSEELEEIGQKVPSC